MMNKKFLPWLPTAVFGVLTVFFTVYYAVTDGSLATVYMQLAVCLFVPAVFPVLGIVTKKPFPAALSWLAGYLVVVGIYFAKTMHFYSFVPSYDKFLHTNFGLVGSAMLYALLLRWGGGKLAPLGQILLVVLGVLGIGAIWEIMEFVGAALSGEDPQLVWGAVDAAIAAGERAANPVTDTMQDLIVTAIGSAVFICLYLADACFGGKVLKKLFAPPGKRTARRETQALGERRA